MRWVLKASFPDPSEACASSAVVKVPGNEKTPTPYQRLPDRQVTDFFKELPSLSLKVTLPDTDSSSSEVILFSISGYSKIIHATSLQSFHPVFVFLVLFIFLTPTLRHLPEDAVPTSEGEALKDPKSSHALPNSIPSTVSQLPALGTSH